jgi:hypothetical protein
MMKLVPCKLHRVHSCRDCHWTPAQRVKANLPLGVGMDAASIPVVRKRAVSMDVVPLSADEVQMLRGIISNHAPKPAPRQSVARRTPSVAFDVNRGGELQYESLNELYRRLKAERGAYKYEF